jgi:hypothetical protein
MPETRWDSAPSQYQRWPARLVRSTTIFLNRQMMHRLPNVFLIKQNRQSIVCSGRWCIVCWFIFRSLKRWPKSCVFTWKHKIRKKVFLTLILFFSVIKKKKRFKNHSFEIWPSLAGRTGTRPTWSWNRVGLKKK